MARLAHRVRKAHKAHRVCKDCKEQRETKAISAQPARKVPLVLTALWGRRAPRVRVARKDCRDRRVRHVPFRASHCCVGTQKILAPAFPRWGLRLTAKTSGLRTAGKAP